MNVQRIEIFKSQDQENGYFDVTFEVEGKLIYAHKFMLAPISTTFNSMFSTSWNKEETIIPISTYSFENFFRFLFFIYSKKCDDLNDTNIFVMLDLAEFYQVNSLKKCCDAYLSRKKDTAENVLEYYRVFSKYFNSLPLFKERIVSDFKWNFSRILKSETFTTLPKEIMEKVVAFQDRFGTDELLFQRVYEWAENQVNIKTQQQRKASDVDNINVTDEIKTEIKPFLSYISFKEMNLSFLVKYVVKRGFLFSYDELSDILNAINTYAKVKITNSSGHSVFCYLPCNSKTVDVIKSLKNCRDNGHGICSAYWNTEVEIPSTPSLITKKDGVEWYLIYYPHAIAVVHRDSIREGNYLLAEMNIETSAFKPWSYCKIEVE